jgi:uncharacterized protein (DUF433 family)
VEAVATGVKNHVEIDENGVAWITGANTKVIQVVLDKLAYGWGPEEMHLQHPHLSLAQIYSALAYYYENKNELDAEIERQSQEAEALKPRLINPALRDKLLELKKLK